MLRNVSNIKRLLLWRLIVLWFLASVVVGGIVFYIEIEAVDREVAALALKQAYSIDQDLIERLPLNRADDNARLKGIVEMMTQQHFMVAEIYGSDKQVRAESVRIGNEKVELEIDARHHAFPFEQALRYKKFYIDKVMYIQLLLPLWREGQLQGYFEGVYRVDQAEIDTIMARLYHTLLIVLVIILATFIMMYPVILYLNRQLIDFSKALFRDHIELMEVMGNAIAKRDSVTDRHNYRVTLYAVHFGEALKLDPITMSNLIAGSFLHDVGKIGVEDGILKKRGRLDEPEFERMKKHVQMGVEIVAKADWLHGAAEVIEFHHEKYDGSGYLHGLKGEDIPLVARMFAIVDVFDALCSERPYKTSMSLEKALQIMQKQRGQHFDPALLDMFFKLAPDLYKRINKGSSLRLTRMLSVAVHKHFFRARLR